MAQLIFFDETHEYILSGAQSVDGENLPSVSEVIRFLSKEIYGNVTQWALDNACERGKKVHKAAEILDKYGEVEADEDIAPYINAYVAFLKENKPEWHGIETAMYHKDLLYAGTIDRAGVIGGRTGIIDIKTSYTVHKPLVLAQLSAYAMMYESNSGEKPQFIAVLHLKPDGTYKLIDFELNKDLFAACLTLHNAVKKNKQKGGKQDERK